MGFHPLLLNLLLPSSQLFSVHFIDFRPIDRNGDFEPKILHKNQTNVLIGYGEQNHYSFMQMLMTGLEGKL